MAAGAGVYRQPERQRATGRRLRRETQPEGVVGIRVFVISGIRLYCDGLSEILARRERIEVAGMASRVEVACHELHLLDPPVDAVLIDVADPIGIEGLREIIAAVPESRILAITVPDREQDVIECAESGAAGFVTRDASIDQLVQAPAWSRPRRGALLAADDRGPAPPAQLAGAAGATA